MKKLTTTNIDSNYLAQVVKIGEIIKHPNADKLLLTSVMGTDIIVEDSVKTGDLMVYCPTESCICHEFLYENNLYSEKTSNKNTDISGYISAKRRIRAILLRGKVSRAVVFPLKFFLAWDNTLTIDAFPEGTTFDTVNGKLFIEKYIPQREVSTGRQKSACKRGFGSLINRFLYRKRNRKLVEPEGFTYHSSTKNLYSKLSAFEYDEEILLTLKIHGKSGIVAYLPRPKTFMDKIFESLSFFTNDMSRYLRDHRYAAASRRALRYVGQDSQEAESLWGEALKKMETYLHKGMSVYFELAGKEGKNCIQKNYDYGCEDNNFKIFVYNITKILPDGTKYTYSYDEITDWCRSIPEELMVMPVPFVRSITPSDVCEEANWRKHFFNYLKAEIDAIERDPICKNKVPVEGYVVRKKLGFNVAKIKSEKFFLYETKCLDSGEADEEA